MGGRSYATVRVGVLGEDLFMSCVSCLHPHVLALSDLHVHYEANQEVVASLVPEHPEDWLVVPGDVGQRVDEVVSVLEALTARFARVVWVPGNHELWALPRDRGGLRGQAKYEELVRCCREIGVVTPEDPFPVWRGPWGRVSHVVPTFLLYDYSFHPSWLSSQEAYERAVAAGHMLTDEVVLHPDPYASRAEWCRERVRVTEGRLAALPRGEPVMVVNHYPLRAEPTARMFSPHLPLWCGTRLTERWHLRYPIDTVVYGHLHMPSSSVVDGVRYEEVSLGYPREWSGRSRRPGLRRVRCGS